jgi:hypothetical protein
MQGIRQQAISKPFQTCIRSLEHNRSHRNVLQPLNLHQAAVKSTTTSPGFASRALNSSKFAIFWTGMIAFFVVELVSLCVWFMSLPGCARRESGDRERNRARATRASFSRAPVPVLRTPTLTDVNQKKLFGTATHNQQRCDSEFSRTNEQA